MMLLENPKGDNKLDFSKLVNAISCIFGVETSNIAVFSEKTGG